MKPSVLIIIAAVIALAGGIAARHLILPPPAKPSPLPEFSLPDLSGRTHRISEWRDKILVINFWATWCPSCREEIPEFIAMQRQFAGQGLQMIGIAMEDREPVDEYIDFIKINYPILIAGDQGMALARQLGNHVDAIPYTVVVDRNGQIIHRELGQFSKEEIIAVIQPLLN